MANTNLDLNGGSLDLGGNTGTIGGGSIDIGGGSIDIGGGSIDIGGGSIDIGGGISTGVTPDIDTNWYPQPDDGSRDEACYLDIKKKFSEYNPIIALSLRRDCPTYSEIANQSAPIVLDDPYFIKCEPYRSKTGEEYVTYYIDELTGKQTPLLAISNTLGYSGTSLVLLESLSVITRYTCILMDFTNVGSHTNQYISSADRVYITYGGNHTEVEILSSRRNTFDLYFGIQSLKCENTYGGELNGINVIVRHTNLISSDSGYGRFYYGNSSTRTLSFPTASFTYQANAGKETDILTCIGDVAIRSLPTESQVYLLYNTNSLTAANAIRATMLGNTIRYRLGPDGAGGDELKISFYNPIIISGSTPAVFIGMSEEVYTTDEETFTVTQYIRYSGGYKNGIEELIKREIYVYDDLIFMTPDDIPVIEGYTIPILSLYDEDGNYLIDLDLNDEWEVYMSDLVCNVVIYFEATANTYRFQYKVFKPASEDDMMIDINTGEERRMRKLAASSTTYTLYYKQDLPVYTPNLPSGYTFKEWENYPSDGKMPNRALYVSGSTYGTCIIVWKYNGPLNGMPITHYREDVSTNGSFTTPEPPELEDGFIWNGWNTTTIPNPLEGHEREITEVWAYPITKAGPYILTWVVRNYDGNKFVVGKDYIIEQTTYNFYDIVTVQQSMDIRGGRIVVSRAILSRSGLIQDGNDYRMPNNNLTIYPIAQGTIFEGNVEYVFDDGQVPSLIDPKVQEYVCGLEYETWLGFLCDPTTVQGYTLVGYFQRETGLPMQSYLNTYSDGYMPDWDLNIIAKYHSNEVFVTDDVTLETEIGYVEWPGFGNISNGVIATIITEGIDGVRFEIPENGGFDTKQLTFANNHIWDMNIMYSLETTVSRLRDVTVTLSFNRLSIVNADAVEEMISPSISNKIVVGDNNTLYLSFDVDERLAENNLLFDVYLSDDDGKVYRGSIRIQVH